MENHNNKPPIEIVDTEIKLAAVVDHLQLLTEFSVDTEFDDFNAQYGVHLQLIQIFDGKTCFLIDPLQIKELDILWRVFENNSICKVLYSGANDIAILKKYGCNTRNIFDNQVAALLCNRNERSYADLIEAELGIEIDKSQQRSRWDNRPLTTSQLTYASNDVIYLPQLKEIFLREMGEKNILHIQKEENILIESAIKKDYEPKLKGVQKRTFHNYARGKLMAFKVLIDTYAKLLNVPPYYIVPDPVLEHVIKYKRDFLMDPFRKGFYKEVLNDDNFKKQFLEIVESIDIEKGWENPAKQSVDKNDRASMYNDGGLINETFSLFKQYIIAKYGEIAGTFILQGLSKKFSADGVTWDGTRQYQRDLYNDFLATF